MASIAGILNHNSTAAQALAGKSATPMAASANGSSSSATSGNSATISANDFLTLLVTEMKNQDPTATTDPNEYINQLVNVNSLQQLIAINQTLSTALTPSSSSIGNATMSDSSNEAKNLAAQAQSASQSSPTPIPAAISAATAKLAPGNLSVPEASPAASRLAQSLSGLSHLQ